MLNRVIFVLLLMNFSLVYSEEKILAIVNKEIITLRDLEDFVNFMSNQLPDDFTNQSPTQLKKQLLDRLIEDRLILQEAEKENIKIDSSRIEARLREIRNNYPSEKEFLRSLSQYGMTPADLEVKIREQFIIQKMIDLKVRNKVIIKPSEVSDFYEKNKEEFFAPAQYELTVLKIEDQSLATQIETDFKSGLSFEDIVNKYSLKPTFIKAKRKGELKPEAEKIISNLREKEVSSPIEIEGSFYVFRLDKLIPETQQKFDEVKERIYNYLYQDKFKEIFEEWISQLKSRAYIKINENEL